MAARRFQPLVVEVEWRRERASLAPILRILLGREEAWEDGGPPGRTAGQGGDAARAGEGGAEREVGR